MEMLIVSAVVFVTFWIYYTSFDIVATKTYNELKLRYLKALIAKDAAWYDRNDANKVGSEVHMNLKAVQKGSGTNVGYIVFSLS
jgi:hypothetical protein